MKPHAFGIFATLLGSSFLVQADQPQPTGPAFYGDPPDAHHPWSIHDRNRPQPPVVTPGTFSSVSEPGKPPSDAIVLFDGTDLSGWESDAKPKPGEEKKEWVVKDGAMECVPKSGQIRSKEEFGDCQLHIEWAAPKDVKGNSQGRGNSGVFLMGLVEVQVLDNYNNPTYADGFAASVYGINPPLANALRPPGEFQVYDIIFRRPLFKDGKEIDPGYLTVFCNGVLVQDHTPLEGSGGHRGRSKARPFPEKGPLKLQDHGNPVRFRNIWYRPLPPRALEGGTDGVLTPEATEQKRQETAASVRKHAESIKDTAPKMLRLMESLVYADHADTQSAVASMSVDYVASVSQLAGADLESKKGEINQVKQAFHYVAKFKRVPLPFAPKAALDEVIERAGWNNKKK